MGSSLGSYESLAGPYLALILMALQVAHFHLWLDPSVQMEWCQQKSNCVLRSWMIIGGPHHVYFPTEPSLWGIPETKRATRPHAMTKMLIAASYSPSFKSDILKYFGSCSTLWAPSYQTSLINTPWDLDPPITCQCPGKLGALRIMKIFYPNLTLTPTTLT